MKTTVAEYLAKSKPYIKIAAIVVAIFHLI
jgi:hypothetical protein